MGTRLGSILLAMTLSACGPETASLRVQLRTDYVPTYEFYEARVIVDDPIDHTQTHLAVEGLDYVHGVTLAELFVPPGRVSMRVQVTNPGLELSRPVVVDVLGDTVATVALQRACEDVRCPGDDDDPTATACRGGRCVSPACIAGNPEACGGLGCAQDGDCPGGPEPCGAGRCLGGACLSVPNDASCGADERCVPEYGCRPRDGAAPLSRVTFDRGDFQDVSGNERHAMCTSCPESSLIGHTFDGVDDCVRQARGPDLTRQLGTTMTIWVEPASATIDDVEALFVRPYESTVGEALGVYLVPSADSGHRLRLTAEGDRPTGGVVVDAPPLAAETWQMVAAVWDGSEVSLWVDAVEVARAPLTSVAFVDAPVSMGCDVDLGSEIAHFAGRLRDARIYGRALYANELRELRDDTRPAEL